MMSSYDEMIMLYFLLVQIGICFYFVYVSISDYMMITLVTQSVFVTLLLLCPWEWLAHFMEVEAMSSADSEQTMFRIYLLLIPALHIILAIAIEVSCVNYYYRPIVSTL